MLSSFRYHDRRPLQVSSPLYRQLIDEWIDLNQLNSSRLAVRRWGRAEPALQGHGRPADLVDAVDGADAAGQDRMLLALVRLTQAGHQLAGRVLLQLMLPKLGRIAIRTAGHGSDSAWTEDRRHIVVAEFWDVISGYPVKRRTSRVAANLSLETLRRVTNPRGREPDRPVDPEVLKQRIGEQVELALPGTLSPDEQLRRGARLGGPPPRHHQGRWSIARHGLPAAARSFGAQPRLRAISAARQQPYGNAAAGRAANSSPRYRRSSQPRASRPLLERHPRAAKTVLLADCSGPA